MTVWSVDLYNRPRNSNTSLNHTDCPEPYSLPLALLMLCPTCNAEIPADAAFCAKCGKPLSAAAAQAAGQAGPAASSAVDRLRPGQHATPHEEEKVLWHGGYSSTALIGAWVLAGILSVGAAIAAVV